ncbi:YkgJ family cysteine cluster protein [Desulfobulbus sp.]|uniref:YkgJ family cysteine cluster protein n=1 Tax=Desulfobulbus sp. TaxID=895 RepID=UPI00286F3644|nr:YkgJ family cysteine cluster protein [Desulfobulbus sp.]
MIEQDALAPGRTLLRQPVLPLVTIVQFLYLTGDFDSVAEVIGQLTEEIETPFARYPHPAADLDPYTDLLAPLETFKAGMPVSAEVVDADDRPVDPMTATAALVAQQVLTRELERINSLLCAPCGCTLCCVGPEAAMAHGYFEIPLRSEETGLFPVTRVESETTRTRRPDDEPPLRLDGRDFFDRTAPVLIRWQPGWSLILPRESRCPNLEAPSGHCRIYGDRPQVCRRPQIFPYVLEPTTLGDRPVLRLRQTLLAVVDCPYVRRLREDIAAFAAACELDMIFRHNKA